MNNSQIKSYRIVSSEVPFKHEQREKISKTFFAISDYLKKYPNPGACHLISSVMYVLLNEQGIESDLCIGEVKEENYFFDHSWIEIDGEIFDIAIQFTLNGDKNPPIFAGYSLQTAERTSRIYGLASLSGLDMQAKDVLKTPFTKYMDGFPIHKEGAWAIIKKIGKELRLKLDTKDLRNKYNKTQRKLVCK